MATLDSGTPGSNDYVFNWTDAATGSYSVTAVATDNTSIAVTKFIPITITVRDSAVTSVSVTAPTSGSTFAAPASNPLAATATNAANGDDHIRDSSPVQRCPGWEP